MEVGKTMETLASTLKSSGIEVADYRDSTEPDTAHSQVRDRVWERAYYFFNLHREEFLSRYYQRSNVESIFGAIKAKLGPSLRSKTATAMVNETLVKILAYNITVLISAMYEFGINPEFFSDSPVVEGEVVLNTQSVMAIA